MENPERVPYKLHEDTTYVVAYIKDGQLGLTQLGSHGNQAAIDRFASLYPEHTPFRVLCLDRMKAVKAVSHPGFEVIH